MGLYTATTQMADKKLLCKAHLNSNYEKFQQKCFSSDIDYLFTFFDKLKLDWGPFKYQ